MVAWGNAGFPWGGDSSDVIGMQVGEVDLVDLLRLVSGRAQIFQEVPATCAIETAGATVDENEPITRIYEESIYRALHGGGEIGGCKQGIRFPGVAFRKFHRLPLCARRRLVPRHHVVDRKRMRAIEQSSYLEAAYYDAVEARRLGANLRSAGMCPFVEKQGYERQ